MTPLNMAFQTVKKTNDQKKLLFSFALETKQNTPFCFNLTLWSVLNWFYFISLHLCKETSNPVVFPSPQTYVHLLSVSASLFAIEKQHDWTKQTCKPKSNLACNFNIKKLNMPSQWLMASVGGSHMEKWSLIGGFSTHWP